MNARTVLVLLTASSTLGACASAVAAGDDVDVDAAAGAPDARSGDAALAPDATMVAPIAVQWTNLVGTEVTGMVLTKVVGAPFAWDAGATSTQVVDAAGGWVEFVSTQTDTYRTVGLSNGNTDTTVYDIDFGIVLAPATYQHPVSIFEAGVSKLMDTTPYVVGDVFRVTAVGPVVTYAKNGIVFYTSTGTPTYPLLVDTSFATVGATLQDVTIYRAP